MAKGSTIGGIQNFGFDMKKYNVIYTDPAWNIQYNKGGKTSGSFAGTTNLPYKTMTDKEIMNLPVSDIAADDALLFMWITEGKLMQGAKIMEAWGFNYKRIGFVWVKTVRGKNTKQPYRAVPSPYTRSCSELCLLGTRGKVRHLIKSRKVMQVVEYASETRLHSAKPPIVRDRIVELTGEVVPKVELFAREKVKGWDSHGFDVDGKNLKESLKLIA